MEPLSPWEVRRSTRGGAAGAHDGRRSGDDLDYADTTALETVVDTTRIGTVTLRRVPDPGVE